MTNETTTKPVAHLAITLSAEAIDAIAHDIISIVEDDIIEKAGELVATAWDACGLPNDYDDGPLMTANQELIVDAYQAVASRVVAILATYAPSAEDAKYLFEGA